MDDIFKTFLQYSDIPSMQKFLLTVLYMYSEKREDGYLICKINLSTLEQVMNLNPISLKHLLLALQDQGMIQPLDGGSYRVLASMSEGIQIYDKYIRGEQ